MSSPLPCPFCGQSAGVMPAGDAGTLIACIMPGCDATAKVYGSTRQEALARWNRRALPSGGDTALLSFVGQALTDARVEEIGDWDGGELQDALERCGIIERVHRVTPCSPAGPDGDATCRCAEFYGQGETAECFPITALGKRAIAVYRDQQDRAALSAPTREPPTLFVRLMPPVNVVSRLSAHPACIA